MIEETKNGQSTIKDAEYWKSLRIALAKNNVDAFADSIPKLKEVLEAALSITTPPTNDKQAEFVIAEVLIPTVRVLVSLQIPEAKEDSILPQVISTLESIMKCLCFLFRQCNILKAADLILAIVDIKKPIYREDPKKTESAATTMVLEPPSAEKQNTTEGPLAVIHQALDEDESFMLQDKKLKAEFPQVIFTAMKRPGCRELFSKLAIIFLEELANVWTTFPSRSPDFIDKYLQILGAISKSINYYYLQDLFMSVREASLEYFKNADESAIRNVTKELFVSLTENYEKLFDRLMIPRQKAEWCELFLAEATLPLVRCRLIKSKLTGTKLLAHLASLVISNNTKAINEKDFKQWLIKNKIFEEIFNLDNHEQVIQQGSDIIKFLVKSNGLQMEQLVILLDIAQKGDTNVRKSIMRTISELTIKLGYMQFDCLINRMEAMPADIYYEDMIEIIYDMCKYSSSSHHTKGMKILWNLIEKHYTSFKTGIQQRLLQRFSELLKSSFEKNSEARPEAYLDQAINLFDSTKDKKLVLSLLKKIVDIFPTSNAVELSDSKFIAPKYLSSDPLKHLMQQRQFHKVLLNQLQKSESKQTTQDYLTFLNYMITNSKYTEQHQLDQQTLIRLMKYPKTFSQCLHHFSDRAQQLLTIAASEPINSQQKMQCVWELFVMINKFNIIVNVSEKDKKYEISCLPQHLRGYHKMLEILVTTLNPRVRDEVASYLTLMNCNLSRELLDKRQQIINSFVQETLEKAREAYKNGLEMELLGYYSVIQQLMNETQKRGVGKLVAHSSLVNTESIKIIILNEVTYGFEIIKKLDFKFPSNKTLYELLTYVATQFKCSPDDIIVKDHEKEIKQRWNGLSIEDLGLHNTQLTAQKCHRQAVPKAVLLDVTDHLTPRAKEVFGQIFFRFSPSGKMTPAELVSFVEGSTHDTCPVNDSRIVETFQRYDDDKDGFLSLKNFLDFYEEASKSRQSTVWRNLDSLQYRLDLRKYEDVKEVVECRNMARYIIYKCQYSYDILFALTHSNNKELSYKAIRLLKRLPTSSKVIEETLNEVGFSAKDQFSVWYKLTLILSILNTEEKINTQQKVKEKQTKDQDIFTFSPSMIAQWKEKFLKSQQYIKILQEAERLASSTLLIEMSVMMRHSLSLCLQILRSLNQVPHLNKPLPETFNLSFLQLSFGMLVQTLIPQLYQNMIIQLFEPLMCFLLNLKEFHIGLITPGLFNKDADVRKICNNFLYLYQKLHNYSLKVLEIPIESESAEFYETVVKLIKEDKNLNLLEIFSKTYESVKNYPLEATNNANHTLLGKIKILDTILALSNTQTDVEFQDVLLKILHGTVNPQIRQILYTMLLRTNPLGLTSYVQNFVKTINPRQNTSLKQSPYVGIQNLGCICYMNSILQQFFMTPEMKYPILGMQLPQDLPVQQSKKGVKYVNNLLYQLQRMFGYLSLSERSEYNPESFCYAYKSDIMLGVQEDAHEFLNAIFNKMEDQLKGSCFANLLNDVFGGTTIVTITCQTCKNYRQRVEDFKSILLGVKDNKNVDESFNQFIDKQTFNGLDCESCGTKVPASTKETHLHTLPNTLIIQLGRMGLDMTTYESIKLHTRLQFPFSMNLSKYVKVKDDEKMPDESDCEYELKGIVIHSGTSAAGHYYSLIKVAPDSWYKFDDSRVTPLNISEIADDAFGGRQEASDWATDDKSSRSKNAFVLLYQKKQKAPMLIKNLKRQEIASIEKIANISTNTQPDEQTYTSQVNSFKGYITDNLRKQVEKDNSQFFHELQFHHEFFIKFVRDLLVKIQIPKEIVEEANREQLKAYHGNYKGLSDEQKTLYHQTHKMIESISEALSKCLNPNSDLIKQMGPYFYHLEMTTPQSSEAYFMTADLKKHLEIMVTNNDCYIRELYRMTANKCISIIIALHNINLQNDEVSPQKTQILNFLDYALSILYTDIPKNWNKSFQYFDFWRWFSCCNPTAIQYSFDRNLICVYIDFIMDKKSPIQLSPKNYTINHKYNTPMQFTPVLQTISNLVLASHPLADRIPDQVRHILTADELTCLNCKNFYKTMIEQKQDFINLSILITTVSKGNPDFSEQIAALLLYNINQTEGYEAALLNTMLISTFMLVKDNLTQRRLQWIFGVPQRIQVGNQYSIKNSLMTQTVSYVSTLYFATGHSCKPILELLFSQRKSPDNFSVQGVSTLLSLFTSSQQVLLYVLELPPPSYMYASYTDWIDQFIEALKTQKYLILNGDRDKMAADCTKSMDIVRARLIALRKDRGLEIEQPVFDKSEQIEVESPQQDQVIKPETESINIEPEVVAVEMQPQEVVIQQQKINTVHEMIPEATVVEEKKPVLLSLKPFDIIGRNSFIDQSSSMFIPSDYSILIQPTVYYTYIRESLPTGDNNLSLKKELFEYHTNYDLAPLKFFVFKETEIMIDEKEDLPEVRATVINLRIVTNTTISIDIRHPDLQAEIYLAEGTHFINVPFIDVQIDKWLSVKQVKAKQLLGQTVAKKQDVVSSVHPDFGNSGFIGPYQQEFYQQEVNCQHCSTFNSFTAVTCSVCGLAPM